MSNRNKTNLMVFFLLFSFSIVAYPQTPRETYQYPDLQPAALINNELTINCISYIEDQRLVGEYNALLIPRNNSFPFRFETIRITPTSGCDQFTRYSDGVLTGTALVHNESSLDLPYKYTLTLEKINNDNNYEFLIDSASLYRITEGFKNISGTYGNSINLSYQGFSHLSAIEFRDAQTNGLLTAWNPLAKNDSFEFVPVETGTWTVELIDHTLKQVDYFTVTYADESTISPVETMSIITDFSPNNGKAGDTITLTGANFSPTLSGNIVKINGIPATVIAAAETQLVIGIPANATSGAITVMVNGNKVTTPSDFTVINTTSCGESGENNSCFDPNLRRIVLNGTVISTDLAEVKIDNNVATITAAGTYTLSGTLTDGQIIVDTEDDANVTLILNGVNLTSSISAPLVVLNANNTILVLAEGTENYITDGDSYIFEDSAEDEPDATLFSKSDLVIDGKGSLTVNANYNDGIKSKDGLTITSGNITVNSVDDGIQGKDYLIVADGNIIVNAAGDGLKSSNDEDSNLGYITIEKGNLNITSGADAIQGETNVTITDGQLILNSGGGSNATISDDASAKGIKATTAITINGGTFSINSADDAIHANENITINEGDFTIASGDDGIHADLVLAINNGEIDILNSYEGIESSSITLNGGIIHIISSDDGVNAAGDVDNSNGNVDNSNNVNNFNPGRFGPPGGPSSGNNSLAINGGYIVVNANGDGLDVNGSATMTDGIVIVNGPISNNNSAVDYDAAFNISGGYLVAAGSSGMAQAPDRTSSQYSVLINFNSSIPAGTLIHIENSEGEPVVTFAPNKNYQSIAFSSTQLLNGSTYNVYYGGSSTGTVTDGLYEGGIYTPGTKYTSFTISSVVTSIGSTRLFPN